MIEDLLTPKLTGFLPPPDSTVAAYFKHIKDCSDDREHKACGLREAGEVLLDQAANNTAMD